MTAWRKTMRADVRAAIRTAPEFAGWTEISVGARSLDASSLPAVAVGTPRELSDRDGMDSSERALSLIVVVKRVGDDAFALEDACDDDAATLEQLVIAAVEDPGRTAVLTETRFDEDAGGDRKVGTLSLLFTITHWPADPLT